MEDRLMKFVGLIDAGSFTAAAERLHVSQPALSVAIAKLERELKSSLIVRGVRPLTLTAAGRIAYEAGQDFAVRNANLRTRLAELRDDELRVSIGMIDSVASLLMSSPEVVDSLERRAVATLAVDNSRNLLQAVSAGWLDVAFVVEQQTYEGVLQTLTTSREPLVVVGASMHAQTEAADSLKRFISYDQASTTYRMVIQALKGRGYVPEPVFYSTSPELMLQLVLQGRGVAALPYLLVKEYLRAGTLAVMGDPPLVITRPIQAVKRRGTVLASPLKHLESEVTRLMQSLEAEMNQNYIK